MEDDLRCPKCGSKKIAKILCGLPAFSAELERKLEEGTVVLGGCWVTPNSKSYCCQDCHTKFGLYDADVDDE